MKKLTIEIETEPNPLSIPDVKAILNNADDELKLHCLLGLNCGFTPVDVAELKQSEVNWETGRIICRRTKMRKKKVPIVNYKLWDTTFQLLKQHRSKDKERVLLNCKGNPLKDRSFKSEGEGEEGNKLRHNDSIGKALSKLVKKIKIEATHKQFRSTSADLLFKQKQYRACLFHELFLGHSIKGITEQSYVSNDDTTLDDCILWLGEQYGIK